MAGAYCAAAAAITTTTTTFITPPIQRTPLKVICSVPTPSLTKPSSSKRRKNYLRPKILKTLKNPCTHPLLPDSTPTLADIPVDSPPEQLPEYPSDQLSCPNFSGDEQKEFEFDEFRQSETSSSAAVFRDGTTVGILAKDSIFKFGLCLVGAFVVQSIVSVWVLGSDDKGKARVLELDVEGKNKGKREFTLNGSGNLFRQKLGIQKDGIVYVDESELEKKIVEIRAMARDVREKEGAKSKENGVDEEEDEDFDDDEDVKTGIEKEVDNKLVNLRKSLNKNYRKPVFSGYSSKDAKVRNGIDTDEFNAKMAIDALMYKKKHKFRSGLSNPSDKPKGFQGSKDDDSVTKLKSRLIERADEMLKDETIAYNDMPIDDLRGNVSVPLEEDEKIRKAPEEETESLGTKMKNLEKEKGRTKPGKEMGVTKAQPLIGNPLENTYERSPVSGVKSSKPINLQAQNSQGVTKEKQDTTTIPNRRDGRARSLKGVKLGNRKPEKTVEKKKSDMESDLWWFSLPYALVILMRSGEVPEGLYTFTGPSHGKGDSSYTVAFEDRGDVTNFCYILQSFFEEMEDFSADIIPLSVKELAEVVQSHDMKVLVVKKGELQLYAGQPLEEVERAFCSFDWTKLIASSSKSVINFFTDAILSAGSEMSLWNLQFD